ncbi:MAG: hypothetical protein ACE5JS_12170, partial [Nitrospinota bacterium]
PILPGSFLGTCVPAELRLQARALKSDVCGARLATGDSAGAQVRKPDAVRPAPLDPLKNF